jgi:hypothetical protein
MYITDASAYPSVNAWARTLAYDSFQANELFLQYLRWLDQSYGVTVACTFSTNRSVTVEVHRLPQLVLTASGGRVSVRWLQPEADYWPTLHRGVSKPDDLTRSPSGAWWQFYLDSKQDTYMLRDLMSHLHK